MKYPFAMLAMVMIAMIALPALVVRGLGWRHPAQANSSGQPSVTIYVYLHEHDTVVPMDLEEYVKGVVAAEMPASFEIEALKAQAVAARTYAVRSMRLYGGPGLSEHSDADVSTDYRQCQAWLGQQQLSERWGSCFGEYWWKVSQAVEATRGLIIVYQHQPITALFHSTAGDRTASAKEVWGKDVPYLQSVPCRWDAASPRYRDTKTISIAEMEQKLGSDAITLPAADSGGQELLQVVERTASGRVAKVRIGTLLLDGTAVREKLGLRSTNFSWDIGADSVSFYTKGYGHGVGMSQYGANGMAREGFDFQRILQYYYTGVNIEPIDI